MDERQAFETGRNQGIREATLASDLELIYAKYQVAAFLHTMFAAIGIGTVAVWVWRRASRV